MRSLTLAAFASVLLFGCHLELELAESVEPLIDATPETGHPAVFYTLSNGGGLCTATLIAPRVVTIAKHCVCNRFGQVLSPQDIRVFSGATVNSGVEYASVQSITAPNPGRCAPPFDNEDFAVITLATAGTLTPYEPVLEDADLPPLNSTLVNIGYGSKYSGFQSHQLPPGATGEKRIRESKLQQVTAKELVITGPGPVACFGDSGGPVFTSDMKQIGVTSRGDATCTSVSIYTKLAGFKNLIEAAFNATGATLPTEEPPPTEPPTPPENQDPTPIPEDPAPETPEAPPQVEEPPPTPQDPAPSPEEPNLPTPEPQDVSSRGDVLYGNGCSAASGRSTGTPLFLGMVVICIFARQRSRR